MYGPAAPSARAPAICSPDGPRTSSCVAGGAALITRTRACVGSGAVRSSVKLVTAPSARGPTVATVVVAPGWTEMVLETIGGSVDPAGRVAIT